MSKSFSDLEKQLGFAELRNRLIADCYTPAGREAAQAEFFLSDENEIRGKLRLTAEMKYILEFMGGMPALGFDDIRPELDALKIVGTFAETECLKTIVFILGKMSDLRSLFSQQEDKTPLLLEWVQKQEFSAELARQIDSIIDEEGEVRSSASAALQTIRKSIEGQKKKIEKNIQSMLKGLKEKGVVEENVQLSIRGGRLVIPVQASKKRMVKGVVLDESATGQTVFLEPIEIFELNNEIQDLEFEEKREIRKILIQLADSIRPEIPHLFMHIQFLGQIDFLRAKAGLALSHRAVLPLESPGREMIIRQGRHPVLEESLLKQTKKIVPLDLELYPGQRVLIISGPNAGGKSVAMKTAGLLQYMYQCGFLVPAAEGTALFSFNAIMADIGDQQSIENDLSTYSSHLLNMKQFMENGNENTLVLMDEFGSGTEPESGGAIAEAVLEVLTRNQVYGIITTHYFNLKMFASHHAGVANAAMLFDNQLLKPQYRLMTGKPGSSFAIEIASSIGLPDQVIAQASSKIGRERIEMEKLVQDLENEKMKLDDRRKQLEIAEEFVSELIEKYNRLNKSVVEKRDRILAKAEGDAKNILESANALIEKTIRDIKQSQAEKDKVKSIRNDFEKQVSGLKKAKEKPLEPEPLRKTEHQEKIKHPLAVGDRVRLIDGTETGVVVELKNQKARVQFDLATLSVSEERLVIVPDLTQKKQDATKKVKLIAEKKESVYQLDFRGMRTEEALAELDKFLDDALLTGVRSFSVLHGKGYGVLRTMIRKHLGQYKDMLEFRDAPLEFGGEGITEVKFLK